MRYLILLLCCGLLAATEPGFSLTVQQTAVSPGRMGNYRFAANFLLKRDGERLLPGRHGIVMQKIDAVYRIEDAAGEDITERLRPRGRRDAYYEVFTIRPNGYSLEVDTFIDRIHPPGTRGRILVWAAARAWLPEPEHRDLRPHPDHRRIAISLPPLAPFFARNTRTQAGDLPSTTIHAGLPSWPASARFLMGNRGSDNIVVRCCLVSWDGIGGDGRTRVERSTMSLSPPDRWDWFWRKHVQPSLDDPLLGGGLLALDAPSTDQ